MTDVIATLVSQAHYETDGLAALALPRYGSPSANAIVNFSGLIITDKDIESPREKFQRLAAEWERATINSSSFEELVSHPAYKAIIRMKTEALPYIFEDLKKAPRHWFFALKKITGAKNVIPEAATGNLRKMTRAWLIWGREHGYC
jgi:hypothetical protein